jgi:hypothetical protein
MSNLLTILKKYFYAAAFIMGCCFLYGCENDEGDINVWTGNKAKVDEAIKVESFMSQDGVMKAKLTAPLMLRVESDSTYVEFPNALHVDFYNDSTKQVETWLDCKYGKYFETTSKVYLRDSVIVINVKGDTLRCPDLWWDQNAKLFYTNKYSEYHTKEQHIFGGEGLEAKQDMSDVTFKKPTGEVGISPQGTLK